MNLSKRILDLQESPIRKLMPLAIQAKRLGKTVYHLNIGQPDIQTPAVFFEAIANNQEKVLKYAHSAGEPELIKSIQAYFRKDGIDFDEDEIIITNGGSEALIFTAIALCDPGDEIIIPEPFYTNYNGFMRQTDVKVVPITTMAKNGFRLPSKSEIESLITPKTKAILFSNPGNPTGVVYSETEIKLLAEIALEHQLFVISDEVYRKIVFDGEESISIGSIKGIEDRAIIIESVSKRYSSCGARIGSVQSKNKTLMQQILKLAQSRLCVSTINQIGAAALYQLDDDYVESVRIEYETRRNVVMAGLKEMGVASEVPKGAFYQIVKLPVKDAEKFVRWLLTDFDVDNETVMLAPAEDFYATKGYGKNEVRIAYVLEAKLLKRAMEILKLGLEKYLKPDQSNIFSRKDK